MMDAYAITRTTIEIGLGLSLEFRKNESTVNKIATISSPHQMRRRRRYSAVGGL